MTEAKTPRGKKKTDWSALAARPSTSPKEIEPETSTEGEAAPAALRTAAAAAGNPAVRTTATGKIVPATKAQTFRLPLDVLEIIAAAKAEAAMQGNKITNDYVVIEAVRMWAKARQRKR